MNTMDIMDTTLPLTNTTTIIKDIITKLKELSNNILDLIKRFIITESYPFLNKYPVIKYALIFIIILIIILCFLLILFNSYTGITQVFNDMFDIDSYRYIDTFDIDLDNNFKKLYLPEFILSGFGIGILISILLYIRSLEKKIIATENTTNDEIPQNLENIEKPEQPEIPEIETEKETEKPEQPEQPEILEIETEKPEISKNLEKSETSEKIKEPDKFIQSDSKEELSEQSTTSKKN